MNIGLQDRSWPQVIQVVKKKQIRPTVPVPGITKITGQGNTADKFLNNFFRQESKDVTCLAKIFRQVNIDVLFHEEGYLIGLMLHANSETVDRTSVVMGKMVYVRVVVGGRSTIKK